MEDTPDRKGEKGEEPEADDKTAPQKDAPDERCSKGEEPEGDDKTAPQKVEADDEPAPKRARTSSGEEVSIEVEDLSWLREDGAKRLKLFQALAGAELQVLEGTSNTRLRLPDPEAGGGVEWARECLRAYCALRTGQTIEVGPTPAATSDWSPPLSVVEVPKEQAKGYVLGKMGARMCQLSEECGVVAVFVQDRPKPRPDGTAMDLKVGALVEAKYGDKDRWFEAKLLEVGEDTVKVKWTYDDEVPDSEVSRKDLRPLLNGSEDAEAAAPVFEVGTLVEALYEGGTRWFEAKVLEVNETSLKVKWTYDDDVPETSVPKKDVKCKPKIETEKVHIYGPLRGRMELELQVMSLVEMKVPGYISDNPRESHTGPDLGFGHKPLQDGGKLIAKVIGKGGSVRKKIAKACASAVEYIGPLAFVVGTAEERACTMALIELIQSSTSGEVDSVPDTLEAICTRVVVPQDATSLVTGQKRATMNLLEEETGTLSFWAPPLKAPEAESAEKVDLKLEDGMDVEGCHEGPKGLRWFQAKILRVCEAEGGGRTVKVRWDYDEDETSDLHESKIRPVLEGEALQERKRKEALAAAKQLVVFGPERPRKAVELRVMSLVESRCPGTYPAGSLAAGGGEGAGFGTEVLQLSGEEAARCPEERRKAVAAAASCVVELVGDGAMCLAGTKAERDLARECLRWLSSGSPPPAATADTCGEVDRLAVPEEKRANLADHVVAQVEQEANVFALFDGGGGLLVCGHSAAKRQAAIARLTELQDKPPPRKRDDNLWDGGQKSWDAEDDWGSAGPARGEKKRVYIVNKDEEERRRKRAARFGGPPPARN